MKKVLLSSAILLATVATGKTVFADAPEPYNSKGLVQFEASTETTPPLDPKDPNKPVDPETDPEIDPEGPQPGTQGPLSIDFASSFNFGKQKVSSQNQTYGAAAQKYTMKDEQPAEGGSKTIVEGPNYVQISDNRGTSAGWVLRVKQNGQFKDETDETKVLTGSTINFINSHIQTNSLELKKPSTADFTLAVDSEEPTGAESIVMSAEKGAGAGTYLTDWGNWEDIANTPAEGEKDEREIANSVLLNVPGSATKYVDTQYRTSFTWTIAEVVPNP